MMQIKCVIIYLYFFFILQQAWAKDLPNQIKLTDGNNREYS